MKDPKIAGDAKRKFQEAYAVLSNKKKRFIYNAGLLGFLGDDGDDEGFCEFMQEMVSMIESEKCQGENSLEDLQRLLAEMADGDEIARLNFSMEEPIKGSDKMRRATIV